ncbi:hypothetical protein DRH14_03795, partial [Candidatus Shapirobacteria bacterium]
LVDILKVLYGDLRKTGYEYEVIVIDNGSKDGSEKLATIANSYNMGVSIARNQGIDASSGEYIFMLDGDIVPVENSINCLLKYLEDNPLKYAIGFHANKFTNQKNKNGQKHHEIFCYKLFDVQIYKKACVYYGLFRKNLFDKGVRFETSGEFGKQGYGWEEIDFYKQMEKRGIEQYVAHINSPSGKYYHDVNSSIKCMGHDEYIRTSKARHEQFKKKWKINA